MTRGASALFSTTQVAVTACTPRGCTTRGSYACLLCNSKSLLFTGCCGTACITCELCLTVLQRKQTSTVNPCWSLHVRPVASFNCLLSNSKKNLQCMKVPVTVYWTQAMSSLSVCSSTERNLQQRMQVSSHVRRVGLPLVFFATQKNTCSASRWPSLHVPPVASVFLFFN